MCWGTLSDGASYTSTVQTPGRLLALFRSNRCTAMAAPRALITGANSGIGKATATGLAERGFRVVMVCRDEERGTGARDEIRKATGNEDIDLLLADLASQIEVRALAETINDRYDRLDVLVNNAGVYEDVRSLTVDTVETTFAVNYLSHFLLTNLLLDLLKQTATRHGEARIVNLGSEAHRGGEIDFEDIHAAEDYGGLQAYAQSKLAMLLFTYELARRLRGTGVTVNCVHPGVVSSNIWSGNKDLLSIAARLLTFFYKSPEKGAEGVLYLATSDEVQGVTGAYFKGTEQVTASEESSDEDLAQRLWKRSAEMVDLEAAVRAKKE